MVFLSGISGDGTHYEYMYDGTDLDVIVHVERNSQEFIDNISGTATLKFAPANIPFPAVFEIGDLGTETITQVDPASFHFNFQNVEFFGSGLEDGNVYIARLDINISGDTYRSIFYLDINKERNAENIATLEQTQQIISGLGI